MNFAGSSILLSYYNDLTSWHKTCYRACNYINLIGLAMYSNFSLASGHAFDNTQLNLQKCIIAGNWTMMVSLAIVVSSLMMTFQFDHYFSIPLQIAGHLATIVFAGLFKVGYVVRCVGVHGLGYRVF